MKNVALRIFLVTAVISLCFFSRPVLHAEELTAALSNITGIVEVIRAGEEGGVKAEEGMTVSTGDTIKTGSDSFVIVTFLPGAALHVASDSEITIRENQLDEQTEGLDTKVDYSSGTLRAILRGLPPESDFRIKTPTAVAAVRGTVYYVGTGGEIYVADGAVSVTNLVTNETFLVTAGMIAIVGEDGSVDGPREPTSEETDDITNEFTKVEDEPFQGDDLQVTPVNPFTEAASDF